MGQGDPRPRSGAEAVIINSVPNAEAQHRRLPPAVRDLERSGPGERWIGGVASGAARRLGIDASIVRIAFVVLAFASGVGVAIYGLGWVLLPVRDAADEVPDRGSPRLTIPAGDPVSAVAFGAVVLGFMLLLRQSGLPFPGWIMWPVLVIAVGVSLISHESRRSIEHALTRSGGTSWRGQTVRVAFGGMFFVGGLIGVASKFSALTGVFLAVVALVGGLAVILLPWSRSMLRALSEERRARVRSEEKADIAAHLHDSVLQTLAIIQRKADDPRQVQALARRQERELRAWLFSENDQGVDRPLSICELLDVIVEEIEESYGINVDVVRVGDAPLDDIGRALMAATREALVNAGKHSGANKVDVYLEVDDNELVVFVRDRGAGFDAADVASDRRGVSDSIVGRLQRAGGRAVIRSAPGEGTEVQLSVSRAATGESPLTSATSATPPAPEPVAGESQSRTHERQRRSRRRDAKNPAHEHGHGRRARRNER